MMWEMILGSLFVRVVVVIEVVKVVVFFCFGDVSFIIGIDILVDGGVFVVFWVFVVM